MLSQQNYETILIEREGGIAVLTLNRPDRHNAANDAMHSELSTVFDDAQRDPTVKVLVMTGAGASFSIGGEGGPDRKFETKTGRTIMQEARHIVDDIIDLEKPFICAVNGQAIGLGATIATLADVSFVARSARLGDPHVLGGFPAGNGSGVIWPLLVGLNRAKYLLMTGEILGADEAAQLGLVTKVVDDGEALNAALSLARRLDGMAPHAVQSTKVGINRILKMVSGMVLPLSLALEELTPAWQSMMSAIASSRASQDDSA